MARGHDRGLAPSDAAAGATGGPAAHHQAGPDPRCAVATSPIVHRSASGAVTMTVHLPVAFRHRGGRKALVSPAGDLAPSSPASRPSDYSPAVKALARAFRWRRLIEAGAHCSIGDIAVAEGITATYVGRLLRLTLLAPGSVEVLLDGQLVEPMPSFAKRPFPTEWLRQAEWLTDRKNGATAAQCSPRETATARKR